MTKKIFIDKYNIPEDRFQELIRDVHDLEAYISKADIIDFTQQFCFIAGLDFDILISPLRKREYADARKALFYYIYRETEITTIKLGKLFNRNHSSVVVAIKQCKELMKYDKEIKRYLSILDKFGE